MTGLAGHLTATFAVTGFSVNALLRAPEAGLRTTRADRRSLRDGP
ncbi:hypothetical protein [Actinoplanes friuliensis]|nr:hypothetical protein [Actinoplanes friuliensis]